MNIPKPVFYLICLSVILAAAGHWLHQKVQSKSNVESLIKHIPEREQIVDLLTAVYTSDKNKLKESLKRLEAKDIDIFVNTSEQGAVTNIWGIQEDEGVTRVAIELQVRYPSDSALQKSGRALFVFSLKDSKWKIEWYFPGAMLLTQVGKN